MRNKYEVVIEILEDIKAVDLYALGFDSELPSTKVEGI